MKRITDMYFNFQRQGDYIKRVRLRSIKLGCQSKSKLLEIGIRYPTFDFKPNY